MRRTALVLILVLIALACTSPEPSCAPDFSVEIAQAALEFAVLFRQGPPASARDLSGCFLQGCADDEGDMP